MIKNILIIFSRFLLIIWTIKNDSFSILKVYLIEKNIV